ncbi:hypothetical protein [Halobellus salinus]|uniref:hypothetical protein n=1 Tax=Halobellus salinus TaxID=931585 RepID=UPI001666FDC7|nr:hypothetical protein [Halobellus salinus]SMP31801.1 hypothetical protein SAMN06265347_11913 [Halobellus salinus]
MNRRLVVAIGVGVAVGAAYFGLLVPDWFVALGAATVYAGAAYLYLASDGPLLGSSPRFEDRIDRVGYAIGVFGVSVSPLAFAQHYGGGTATVAFVGWTVGVIAFVRLAATTGA